MSSAEDPIAVIGIGCRFPGSSSTPSQFWDLLSNPKDVGSSIPRDRFGADTFYHPDGAHHGTTNVRKAYFLAENVAAFDAAFFKVSSNEAQAIDPQQRLVLETVYESVEAAGLRLDDLKGTATGIFCGVMCDDYQSIQQRDISDIPHYTATGTARSIISNRVSYFFDWHGPSMTIDTACSSSLVAVHLASNALRDGSCRVAVASGTNLILAPSMFITGSKLGMLSPQGRSRMWDAGADGYARGEGVAAVVLKRLSDAIADKDPIECVIRATNINQDGRSMGITMPSSAAQTSLIQSTYRKAGLDPVRRSEDRCQYFEAHGTGTPAGDPQEAKAIHEAFFPQAEDNPESMAKDDMLYVGSVKTVIGHTEGTAGLAALIKAAQSVQKGVIVPNMHFNRLNPAIEQHYRHLEIPTECQPWPELPAGAPRRVSVNSFGFGGTNAHAILESYPGSQSQSKRPELGGANGLIPFVFSAPSDKALGNVLASYVEYLNTEPAIDPADLAWTLFRRRTAFYHRVALHATSLKGLGDALQDEISRRVATKESSTVVFKPLARPQPRILGVFTGQGAQWPQMGLDLLKSSPEALQWLDNLQASLDRLPPEYWPNYSLLEELCASQERSRLHLAHISQPLCTAVQIILVQFLQQLGIRFEAVVGHSSGEIAAAYAAGTLSAEEAIRIAHLRGHVTSLAGCDGKDGAMLAVGMSADEAEELCQSSTFIGRVNVAAVNASSSITLSGDAEHIQALAEQLSDEGIFARIVKVNMAYHSYHMLPCSEPYKRALEVCGIEPQVPGKARWFSSVHKAQEIGPSQVDELRSGYWADNMLQTVLFADSVTAAMKNSSYDMIVEVGPHPALKGPVLSTVSDCIQQDPPNVAYTTLLNRSVSGMESSTKAIGELYSYLGPDHVNIEGYMQCFNKKGAFRVLKGLPCYPFDRSNSHWAESRLSKAFYRDAGQHNQLLGSLSPETTEGAYRWRNFLRPSEIDWLNGHCIQSQVVFPATGYVAMALEAAYLITGGRRDSLFEIRNLVIKSGITLNDDEKGAETVFEVNQMVKEEGQLSAVFACFSTVAGKLQLCASGNMLIVFGAEAGRTLLPSRQAQAHGWFEVDTDRFYNHLNGLGYGYEGLFKGISCLRWKKNMSDGYVRNASQLDGSSPLRMHPALMDLLLQGLLAAVGKPGNDRLYTLHIPVSIGRVLINPAFCGSAVNGVGDELPFEAVLTSVGRDGAVGDGSLFDSEGNGIVQMERIKVAPLMQATASDDRQLFFGVEWGRLLPDLASSPLYMNSRETERCASAEKLALVYMRNTQESLTAEDRAKLNWHGSRVVSWIDHVLLQTREGTHPVCQREWLDLPLNQTYNELARAFNPVEQALMRVVGQNLLRFLRHETTILEELRQSGLLDAIYKETEELAHFNQRVADVVAQLATRFPRMRILEIGAGSGSATKAVLNRLKTSLYSYTFTDISAGFFDQAEANFADLSDLMSYRILDIEQDPLEQGFQPGSFDLVIAANVLHATRDLQHTLSNTRRLLKPGGHLVSLEGCNPSLLRTSFTMSGFEGWWLGEKDGRPWGAMTTPTRWHSLLQRTGFSGIDTITPGHDDGLTAISVFATQAVDDHIQLLRDPLSSASPVVVPSSSSGLAIVGGASLSTSKLARAVEGLLRPSFAEITHIPSLEMRIPSSVKYDTILNLGDLDSPFFQRLNPESLKGMQHLIKGTHNVLWVTAGSDADNPYQSMSQALLRCLQYESSQARFQHLNIQDKAAVGARIVAETLLRLVIAGLDNDYRLPRITDTIETELRVINDVVYIPRITPDSRMNERFMSQRRLLYHETDPERDNVRLSIHDDGTYESLLTPAPSPAAGVGGEVITVVRVMASTLTALRVQGGGFLYLSIGHNVYTQQRVAALATENAAVISTPSYWVVSCPDFGSNTIAFLSGLAWALVAVDLIGRTAPHSSILVHEASKPLRAAIELEARKRSVAVYLSSAREAVASDDSQVSHIHPFTSTAKIAELIPDDLASIADLDATNPGFFSGLPSVVHGKTIQEGQASVHSTRSKRPRGPEAARIANVLQRALEHCTGNGGESDEVTILDVRSVPESRAGLSKLQLVDWQAASTSGSVPVSTQTASSQVTLSADKTYLLVGMTGDLGMSVCQWMISRGARNVVLTSRKPQTDQSWIDSMMAEAGARVVTMSMDVTCRESTLQVDRRIRQTLPPIGGVVNGAMILQDQLFTSMTFEAMDRILKPKVQGSLLLDELYQSPELDFFICFGSLTGPAGNTGQSAYSAATSFMASLVERRRKRGLPGSTICPGEIRGVGYVARTDQALVDLLRDAIGDTSISEGELNELFAEAILASHPDSSNEFAPIAGFPMVDPEEQPHIVWLKDPRMWRQLRYSAAKSAHQTAGEVVSVRQQLAAVNSVLEVRGVILGALLGKLRRKLQVPEEVDITEEHSLMELGIDSLVAVDLRTWFVKEVAVDMPVMKILNNSCITELIDHAAANLPPDLRASCDSGENKSCDDSPTLPEKAVAQEPSSTEGTGRAKPLMDRKDSKASIDTQTSSPPSNTFDHSDQESYSPPTTDSGVNTPRVDKTSLSTPKFDRTERLSYAQSRFWFLQQLRSDKAYSNVTLMLKLDRAPDVNRFRVAVSRLAQRHEILRTCYRHGEDGPYQAILAHPTLRLEVVPVKGEAEARDIYHSHRQLVYDLENGDNFRICLAIAADQQQFVIIGFHHICLDGLSFHMLLQELEAAYLGEPLDQLAKQYADYAAAQRNACDRGEMASDVAYWKNELRNFSDPVPLLPMSKVRTRQALVDHPTETVQMEVPTSIMAAIETVSKQLRVTPATWFMTVLRIFIARYTEAADFCIGMSDVHRVAEGDYNLIGLLMNLLPIRFLGVLEDQSFKDVLLHTQKRVRGALAHSRVQFDRLLDELSVSRSATHSPLFQVMLDWQPQNTERRRIGDIQADTVEFAMNKTAFDMVLQVLHSGEGTTLLNFRLQQALYSKDAAHLIAQTFFNLLKSIVSAGVDQKVTESPLHPAAEIQRTIDLGKGPSLSLHWPSTVSKRIDQVVRTCADHVAVKEVGRSEGLTYRALGEHVGVLAAHLAESGVGPGSRVCVCQQPSEKWIPCMLAIWRLGAIYVPLDVNNPAGQMALVVQDCQPHIILCDSEAEATIHRMTSITVDTLNISRCDGNAKPNRPCLEDQSAAEHCSVILYSSGTTGRPKGFQLSHANLQSQLEGFTRHCKLEAPTILQQGAMTFDISLEQMLTALTTGGRVVVAPRAVRLDPSELARTLVHDDITCTMATPSEYLWWNHYAPDTLRAAMSWRVAFSGGEAFPNRLCDVFKQLNLPDLRVCNFYGPGETTIASHQVEIDYKRDTSSDDPMVIPVGYSLPNYDTYIVDPHLNPVPQGISGEIVIAGPGVCLGYVHLDDLNRTKFLPTPGNGHGRAYRTTERGYLRPDGALLLLGRLEGDTQVKLRGIRMDLCDVENEILRVAQGVLTRVVVSLRESKDPFLAAHAEFRRDYSGDKDEFLRTVRSRISLPPNMRPTVIVPVEEMPTTVHGKLDRRAISSLALPERRQSSIALESGNDLSNSWVQRMVELWQETLEGTSTDCSELELETDFFFAGGSSILLVKLQLLLARKYGVKVPLITLLDESTLREMANAAGFCSSVAPEPSTAAPSTQGMAVR
ncbi:hypothetical protein BJX99DRAFT_259001 [Aspergillus californicus]